jgi:hypothetical protein
MIGQHQRDFLGKIENLSNWENIMGCSDIQDIQDTLPGNMAEPDKESNLYLEAHKCMRPDKSTACIERKQ